MLNATAVFAEVLPLVPLGVPPFPALEEAILVLLNPPIPNPGTFDRHLHALSAILGVELLLILCSLGIRWYRVGEIWLFRLNYTAKGTFVVPHFAVSWQICSALFLALLQGYIYIISFHNHGKVVSGFMAWNITVWIPSWIAAWGVVWSIAAARYLQFSSSPSMLPNPRLLSFAFLSGLFIVMLAVSIVAAISSERYNAVLLKVLGLIATFESDTERFSASTQDQTQQTLKRDALQTQGVFDVFDSFILSFRIAWAIWALATIFLYVVLAVVAAGHLGSVRKELRRLRSEEDTLVVSGQQQTAHDVGGRRRMLSSAWQSTVGAVLMITIVGAGFSGSCVFLTIDTYSVIQTPKVTMLVVLFPLYLFAFSSSVAVYFVFRQSIKSGPAPRGHSSGSISARAVASLHVSPGRDEEGVEVELQHPSPALDGRSLASESTTELVNSTGSVRKSPV